jgi:hypothetical protein
MIVSPVFLLQWTATAGQGQVIVASFLALSLEFHSNCQFDSVTLFSGTSILGTRIISLCGGGSVVPAARYVTSGNAMVVSLSTDSSNVADGFRLRVQSGGLAVRTHSLRCQPPCLFSLTSVFLSSCRSGEVPQLDGAWQRQCLHAAQRSCGRRGLR